MKFSFKVLSSNLIKIIAVVLMFIDHLGFIFFPDLLFLRIIGRLAFPIFAFCIAEGAKYTKNYLKYFLLVFCTAIICDITLILFCNIYESCVLTTFSLSLVIIWFIKQAETSFANKNNTRGFVFVAICVFVTVAIYFINRFYFIEYGIVGALIAPILYLIKNHYLKLVALIISCLLLTLQLGQFYIPMDIQWVGVFSAIILLFYNGKRGKYNMKYFFYLFYPAHLAIMYGIQMLIG